jgi:hypothetical protein
MGDFEQNVIVHIYYDGIVLFDEKDKYFEMKLNVRDFRPTYPNHHDYIKETCQLLKYQIERRVKEDLITKLRNKIDNVVRVSRETGIPVKYLLNTFFLNNRHQQIEIIWSPSAIKEFTYVPLQHYLTYQEDSLTLKIRDIKFLT